MKLKHIGMAAATAVAMALVTPLSAQAASEFTRPVRIIVPFAPGGTSDILARLFSPRLSEAFGQSVVVENKPGANGNVGADAVAKAPKDGHIFLLMDVGSLATAPTLFPDLTFDVKKDLAPVGMIMFAPYVFAAHPSVPAKSIKELVDYNKANPGKLAMANSGVGAVNHITGVIIGKALGIDWKHVPYKGGAAASRAVVSGESNLIINGATATMPFVTNGQMIGLAVSGSERLASAPNLPTFKEAGLPQGDAGTWQGVLATAGSPRANIDRFNAELRKILAVPEIQQKIAEQGGVVKPGTPEEFGTWMDDNIKSFGEVIRANNIKPE